VPKLREVGEFEALRRLIDARRPGSGVVIGPGDDAAVLAPGSGREIVVTTDALVEGRHFLPEWLEPPARGARLATMNLSDLAAMAAEPRWATLSLGLRQDHDLDALLELQRGVDETLAPLGAAIVGGNLTAVEGSEWYDLALIGEVAAGAAWKRSGARAGDFIMVSGSPGRAGAGLRLARRLGEGARDPRWRSLIDAWRMPVARIALSRALLPTGAVRAAIDLSDGLAADLERMARASAVAVEVDLGALPVDPDLENAATELGIEAAALRLGASDDYELILAVAPGRDESIARAASEVGVSLHVIARAAKGSGVVWRGGPAAAGYDHFSS